MNKTLLISNVPKDYYPPRIDEITLGYRVHLESQECTRLGSKPCNALAVFRKVTGLPHKPFVPGFCHLILGEAVSPRLYDLWTNAIRNVPAGRLIRWVVECTRSNIEGGSAFQLMHGCARPRAATLIEYFLLHQLPYHMDIMMHHSITSYRPELRLIQGGYHGIQEGNDIWGSTAQAVGGLR